MRLIYIFLFLGSIFGTLSAQESSMQILVTKTSKASNLKKIKNKLEMANVKMYIQKMNKSFFVYSEIYHDEELINTTLANVKVYFPSARILVYKKVSPVQEQEAQEEEEEEEIIVEETTVEETTASEIANKIFISASYGFASINAGTNNTTALSLENSGSSLAFEVGYLFFEELSLRGGYLNASTDDISFHNFYTSLNYSYHIYEATNIYAGGIFGYSSLELDNFSSSVASNSSILGFSLGANYEFYESTYIFGIYQGMSVDHTIVLDSSTNIEFTFLHNMHRGVEYRF